MPIRLLSFARFALAAAGLAGLLLAACDGESSGGPTSSNASTVVAVTQVPKPATVPAEARAVEQSEELGSIERQADQTPETAGLRRLEDPTCAEDVIVLTTQSEVIYAARDCDGFWDEETKELFVGKEVVLVLEVTDERTRLLVESVEGAQGEFTVGGIWVLEQ